MTPNSCRQVGQASRPVRLLSPQIKLHPPIPAHRQAAEWPAGPGSRLEVESKKTDRQGCLSYPAGARMFTRMFTRLGCSGRPPHFVVEFYPYAGLVQTIRLRDDVAYIRFSDLMRDAPARVLEAAAAVLLAKLYRRRLPAELDDAYREYSLAQPIRRRAQRLRSRRARRITLAPTGAHHSLEPLFDQLNQRYFAGSLRRPHIGWSARPWRKQLGCFDPALDQIVLSSRLDHPRVPRCVVEYVLYHEMLHVKHPVRRAPTGLARCGLQTHSPRFRAEEKRYAHYAVARRFLLRFR